MRTFTCCLAGLLIGCASSWETEQTLHVTSDPPGAAVQVTCGGQVRDAGTTPLDVAVSKSAEHCSLTLMKAGYLMKIVDLTRVGSKKVWGIVRPVGPGAVGTVGFGVALDSSREPGYRQVPERVDVRLDPLP